MKKQDIDSTTCLWTGVSKIIGVRRVFRSHTPIVQPISQIILMSLVIYPVRKA